MFHHAPQADKVADLDIEPTNIDAPSVELRLDPAGKPLVPTATNDPLDPLNWSLLQKYTIVGIVCFFYFLLTYLTTAPVPSFFLLEEQFDASYATINWSFAISAFGLALGPLVTSDLAETYGRRTVVIASTSVALVASGCTSIHGEFIGGYMAARFFQGLGAGPAANVGLAIINDISWQHERGFRIGMWSLSANVGSVLGGLIGGFLAGVSQYWVAYHVTILFSALLLAEILLLPETLYPREDLLKAQLAKNHEFEKDNRRTKQLGWFNVQKVPSVPHPKPWATIIIFCKLWSYPNLVMAVVGYVFFQYWWIVNILTMLPFAYSQYKVQIQGLLFTGLLFGVIFSELFCSGWLSDWMILSLVRRGKQRVPEMRLWLGYPAAVLSTIGLIVWGASVERTWHWITGQIAIFIFAVGLQVGNMTMSAYIVDCYPDHTIEIITFYSVVINMSAFIAPWFIFQWIEAVGYTWCFSTQALICIFCLPPTYIILQRYGHRLRKPMILHGKGETQVGLY